jgi:hypothetical protein
MAHVLVMTGVVEPPMRAEIRPRVARTVLGVVHDLVTRALREEIGDADQALALRADCQSLAKRDDEALVAEIQSLVERTVRLANPESSPDLETAEQLFDALQPVESWVKDAEARSAP